MCPWCKNTIHAKAAVKAMTVMGNENIIRWAAKANPTAPAITNLGSESTVERLAD